MIVRDEAKHLADCLASLKPWVDEVCVVDTGSLDGTPDIARELGARVKHIEWTDDFSAARNVSLEMATHPWILVVDADERLDPQTGPALRQATADPQVVARLVHNQHRDARGRLHSMAMPRLFRNLPEIRFSRPIHESIMDSVRALGAGALGETGVRLHHLGYQVEPAELDRKYARNLAILRRYVAQNPQDLYATFKMAATLRKSTQRAEQIATFRAAYELARAMPRVERCSFTFVVQLHDRYARALIAVGDLGEARRVVAAGLRDLPHAVELIVRRGDLALRIGDLDAAERHFTACLRPRPVSALGSFDPAARSVHPAMGLARIAAARGKVPESWQQVQRVLTFDSEHVEARCLAVKLRLAMGDPGGATKELAQLLASHPLHSSVRLLGGEIAWMRGDTEGARELWEANSADDDAGVTSRCWLAISQLIDGALEDAFERLSALPPRELRVASAQLMAAACTARAYTRPECFRARALINALVGWLRELLVARATTPLSAFADNAHTYDAQVPGIAELLTRDGQRAAR